MSERALTDGTPYAALNSVEMLEIEQRLEEFWHAEVAKVEAKLSVERNMHHKLRHQVNSLIASVGVQGKLNPTTKLTDMPEDLDELKETVEAIRREIDKAADFQKLMDYVNSNEILRNQWNRLMVGIRMSGGDEHDPA